MPYFQSCVGRAFQEDLERDADHLLETQYTMDGPGRQKVQCDMLGLAHNERSFTIGINSSKFWQDLIYTIEKETIDGSTEVDALCLTHTSQIQSEAVRNQIKISDGGFKDASERKAVAPSGKRVVVVGVHDRGMLIEVLLGLGVDYNRFEFIETADVANYDCTRWQNSNSIAALMVGAVPHKAAGMGEATSVLEALRKQPGYPHVETLTETMEEKFDAAAGVRFYVPAGKLNITKNSFRCGLMNLMNLGLI